jgi:predicted protein tyrosine phosphatase
MDLFVYSRQALEAARPHEVPHLIISITSHVTDRARLRLSSQCRAVLRLSFVDAEDASDRFAEADLFSSEQAQQIWALVVEHHTEIERIVVHCDAGISRSAAVAAALARRFGGDETQFFSGKYHPNARVYRMLVEEAPTVITTNVTPT